MGKDRLFYCACPSGEDLEIRKKETSAIAVVVDIGIEDFSLWFLMHLLSSLDK